MEIEQKTVLVAGIDVVMNRFEGEILTIDRIGNWAPIGRCTMSPRVYKSDRAGLLFGPLEVVEAPPGRVNSRPWLGRKKGRTGH